MSKLNSRFITYPDVLTKSTNHTVVIINPQPTDIEAVGYFCKTSLKEYDVYLYNIVDEYSWLESVSVNADKVLKAGEDNLLEYFNSVDVIE